MRNFGQFQKESLFFNMTDLATDVMPMIQPWDFHLYSLANLICSSLISFFLYQGKRKWPYCSETILKLNSSSLPWQPMCYQHLLQQSGQPTQLHDYYFKVYCKAQCIVLQTHSKSQYFWQSYWTCFHRMPDFCSIVGVARDQLFCRGCLTSFIVKTDSVPTFALAGPSMLQTLSTRSTLWEPILTWDSPKTMRYFYSDMTPLAMSLALFLNTSTTTGKTNAPP